MQKDLHSTCQERLYLSAMGLSETMTGQDLDHVFHKGDSITKHHVGDYSSTVMCHLCFFYCDAFICNSSM